MAIRKQLKSYQSLVQTSISEIVTYDDFYKSVLENNIIFQRHSFTHLLSDIRDVFSFDTISYTDILKCVRAMKPRPSVKSAIVIDNKNNAQVNFAQNLLNLSRDFVKDIRVFSNSASAIRWLYSE